MAKGGICAIVGCDKPSRSKGWCGMHYMRWKRHKNPERVIEGRAGWGDCSRFIEEALAYRGDECLPWPYAKTPAGYGQVYISGRLHVASRVVCERVNGPPPSEGLDAAHSCGNGHLGCVTPSHLSWKTRRENIADMEAHGTARRGAKNSLSQLSEDDVREIRRLRGVASQAVLGRRFGVHGNTIGKIQLGIRWGWLK